MLLAEYIHPSRKSVQRTIPAERFSTDRRQQRQRRNSRHAWFVVPDKATKLHKHRQRHESRHSAQACRGPIKQFKTDVTQRSRAVASDRSGNTHTQRTCLQAIQPNAASQRRRDAVLQQRSGGNLGGARVRQKLTLSLGGTTQQPLGPWLAGAGLNGEIGLSTRARVCVRVCDGTLVLREGSRLCLGGCHMLMYTYTGAYGVFFEVSFSWCLWFLPYAVEWARWTRRVRIQVG